MEFKHGLESDLCWAASKGDEPQVERLLRSGSKADEKDLDARSALYLAAENGHIECARLLIEAGASVNAVAGYAFDRRSPLLASMPMFGIAKTREPLASMLLDAGADWRLADANGRSAWHHASNIGSIKTLERILELDPTWDLAAVDSFGRNALHYAAQTGWPHAMGWLLDKGLSANSKDAEGTTPLHILAASGDQDGCRMLLDAGADPASKNKHGHTARDSAILAGEEEMEAFFDAYQESKILDKLTSKRAKNSTTAEAAHVKPRV